jgi:DNA (cytosine-5)-methyltransferase 1
MKNNKKYDFKFIDLFAGIGGFHLAMHNAGGECVFASEWDKFARITYEHNYKKISPNLFKNGRFNEDLNDVNPEKMPDFDVLCAGFPCQPFSHAGLKMGFEDTRGTLFFKMAEIIDSKIKTGYPPKVLLLENVKGLRTHDKGRTLATILRILEEMDYIVDSKVLNSKYFGVPQNRERIFIVAWRKGENAPANFKFPLGLDEENKPIFNEGELLDSFQQVKLGDILMKKVDEKYTISDKLYAGHIRRLEQHRAKGNGFGFSMFNSKSPYTSTISARYYKDGSEIMIEQKGKNPRKLHPIEAAKLQGYPVEQGFEIVVSDNQAYKQFGNSVSVPVVKTLAAEVQSQILQGYFES